jgi:uncharacterized protein YegP (UPF0339 family)
MARDTIEIFQTKDGLCDWRCRSPNGRITCQSTQGYRDARDAQRAARRHVGRMRLAVAFRRVLGAVLLALSVLAPAGCHDAAFSETYRRPPRKVTGTGDSESTRTTYYLKWLMPDGSYVYTTPEGRIVDGSAIPGQVRPRGDLR